MDSAPNIYILRSYKSPSILVFEVVPDEPGVRTIDVGMDLDLEGLRLRDGFFLPNEEAVEQEEEVILK